MRNDFIVAAAKFDRKKYIKRVGGAVGVLFFSLLFCRGYREQIRNSTRLQTKEIKR